MSFELFIAKRYFRSTRRMQFVSTINVISILGIMVGVAALLIILSVFNGFTSVVGSILVGFDPHVRIEQKGGMTAAEYERLRAIVDSDSRVRGYSPFVTGKAMLVSRTFTKVVYVKGVDERMIGEASGLKEKIVLGQLALDDSAGSASIILGLTLADRLGVTPGAEISIISPYAVSSMLMPFTVVGPSSHKVTAVFESNNKEYDANYAYVALTSAQRLFKMEGKVSGLEMRLKDISLAEEVKAALIQQLPSSMQVLSWFDLHKDLFSVMKVERWVAYILLCLIILVASFNMLGSLTMSVIEKQRDIGVLQSLGATHGSIIRIFMFDGILVGLAGTVLGIVVGLTILYLQMTFHLVPLDTTVYIIPAIPVEIHIEDFLAVSFASLLLSSLAAYYPARRAARVVPVEAIRWE